MSISVIIPAFNAQNTIEATLNSVIEGNLELVKEIIVTDDCSTDKTTEIVKKLQCKHDCLRLLSHQRNRGGAASRNTAIANAKSEYIFCLDSDNLLESGSICSLFKYANNEDADVASFKEIHFFCNESLNPTHIWQFPTGQFSLADYLAGTVVPGASGNYLFKKSAWQDVGGYEENSSALDSWFFGFKLLSKGKKVFVSPSGRYLHRYGMNSYWVRESKRRNIGIVATQLLEDYFNIFDYRSVEYILSSKGLWFDKLDTHPIQLASSEVGRAGITIQRSLRRKVKMHLRSILDNLL
jgi:glycosyltransferase involved in cell wall biosynthesis